MTDDLSSPHRPVRLLAHSQSSTFQISLTRVFPSCFRSSSLPFPWYIRSQYFPQYVFTISPHHMPVPDQSPLGDLFGLLLINPRNIISNIIMIFNINSSRGQMRFLTCVARVTCLVRNKRSTKLGAVFY